MTRLLVYILLFGCILYILWAVKRREQLINSGNASVKVRSKFRSKKNPQEIWVQVYETAQIDEARIIQARLQEEEVECILYEQGKKDIHGNELRGVGIAVPKSAVLHAQNIISRMPV